MSEVRTVRLNILQQSPHDASPPAPEPPNGEPRLQQWVPSYYNVRATADDGRFVLWNSLRGSMSVFNPAQGEQLLSLLKKDGFEAREEGLVKYLVERGFLVKKEANEYRQFQLLFGQQHYRTDVLHLILLSSEDCNFRCKYCYEEFARGTMLPEVRQSIKKLIEKRIKALKQLQVQWFGGEPLYGWAAVEELGPFFAKIAEEHGVPYNSQMTTNAYLLTPDVAVKLLAWKVSQFQITLDGLPENHDCSRPTRDGQGTFWTIFENLKSLARRKDEFHVSLRVNFDQTNAPRMGEFLDLVEKEFKDDHRFKLMFHPVGRWGGPNDAALEVCGAEQSSVLDEMKAAAHARGLHFYTLKDMSAAGGQVCYAARPYNYLIGATGKIMKCTISLDTDDDNIVGRITEDGDLLLDRDKMALWTEPTFQSDSQCQKCAVLPSCQGLHCPLVRMKEERRACVSTRQDPHGELLEAMNYGQAKARKKRLAAENG
jgi:uncharacterized protein